MAEINSTHPVPRKSHHLVPAGQPGFTIPRVPMPSGLKSEKWDATFTIQTPKGDVRVECFYNFECFGTADALEAAGLLHPNWLPGLPGNNKSRQTVLFTREGPHLVLGKAPSYRDNEEKRHRYIVITRAGKKFTVQVPATEAQEVELSRIRDEVVKLHHKRIDEQRRSDQEAAFHNVYSDPEAVHGRIRGALQAVQSFLDSRLYKYSAESDKRIFNAIADLEAAINNEVVVHEPIIEYLGGNVLGVNFRNRRADTPMQ